jgi:hypothetical protein
MDGIIRVFGFLNRNIYKIRTIIWAYFGESTATFLFGFLLARSLARSLVPPNFFSASSGPSLSSEFPQDALTEKVFEASVRKRQARKEVVLVYSCPDR